MNITAAQIYGMNRRQLAALISEAYSQASALVRRVLDEATGSGAVIDMTGGTPRIVGNTEQFGNLASHPHHFVIPTTGGHGFLFEIAVEGMAGRTVGIARACERRPVVVERVAGELADRARAADLDPEAMYSGGVRTSMPVVAERLVDLAIDRIEHANQGRTAELVRAALELVPDDAFTAAAR